MKELAEFWKNLTPKDKHLDDRSKWAEFLGKELLSRIKEPIRSVVDYGPGGGWVDLNFDPSTEIHLFDICQESLDEAWRRLFENGFRDVVKYLLPPSGINPTLNQIDLIICTLVINHFPNYAYFLSVAKLWKECKPKYIVFHQRHTDKTVESKDFEDYKIHYGRGLLMSTEDSLAPFLSEYREIYHSLEDERFGFWGIPGYEFFILKRK